MSSTSTEQPAASALQAAVDSLEVAVEHLIKLVGDGALGDLGAFGLVDTLQAVERVRNKLPVVDRAMIQYGAEQGVPAVLSERTMTRVLTTGLRLSPGEASRRVRAADHLADRTSMTGEPLAPVRTHLSAAQREGLITPEQVTLIEAIDPDGILPADEAEHRLRRLFHLKHRTDGSWAGDFRLTPDVGHKLAALLGPLTTPQTTRFETESAPDTDEPSRRHVVADERTHGQRQHDALAAALDAALRTDDLPTAGGTPTTLLLTMSWEDFHREHGLGHYADGTPVSARTARLLADQADIAICIKGATGAVLDLHRTRRIASPAQTLALIARDAGCSFPGCDVAPQWCERHHVIAWYDGGPTNLANLTLVCSYHHHQFAQRGWQCQINPDGLPVWIPPKWIDRHQRPILNARITITNWDPQDPLDLAEPLAHAVEPPQPPD